MDWYKKKKKKKRNSHIDSHSEVKRSRGEEIKTK